METTRGKILLVDDDPGLLRLLSLRLKSFGHEVKAVESGEEALVALDAFRPETVITDLRMERIDGMQLLDEIHRRQPSLPVLIITAHGTIPDAVAATQRGAFGFLTKPIEKTQLQDQVVKALRVSGAAAEMRVSFEEIITRSPAMEEVLARARMVAQSDTSLLITGQSGTGKELLARAIHNASKRADNPFLAINCGAIPEQLLESELFGHQRGAFTGAVGSHTGIFKAANGGTLLLDEIGDMPIGLQMKLLRVLQEGEVRPVGSTQSTSVDVRVLSATHRDLPKRMAEGMFREDLFYRLNVVNLHLPPLSARREDIPVLVTGFLEHLAKARQEPHKIYAPEAMELLVSASWPGNVRHLYNVVEQNVVLSATRVISARVVQDALGGKSDELPSYNDARAEFTRSYLTQLLNITDGNVSQAAKLAKRNRTDFYKLLSRFQIDPAGFKPTRHTVAN
ncbi:MAG: sigma 54-interacting transcriptional regulator [Gammaproteobacteria bacterium]|nr:sigma 54-interacting transcriptional regulator [Gammaproteobacteria bacterium]